MSSSRDGAPRLLLAGASPGGQAGNSVSTEVLLDALRTIADVTVMSHRMSPVPSRRFRSNGDTPRLVLGTQPLFVHGEAVPAGLLHRHLLRAWRGAWVVNSRYAGALYAAGVPYIIWEATTLRDELGASTLQAVRRSGRGTGLGRALHHALLPIGDRMERALYDRAAAVLVMSPYTRRRMIEQHGIRPERVRVLAHPTTAAFRRTLAARSGIARQDGIGMSWRLLFVGRADDPRKNLPHLLRVVQRLRGAGHGPSLTVIGPYNDAWRARLPLEGIEDIVTFAGAVSLEQLVDAYLTHDLLVVPSRQEGLGIVVAEAFAAGLPVVATRCGGPEHMLEESSAGILVGHDVEELAKVIETMMRAPDRRAAMRERGVAYASAALGFESFASAVADITEEMLIAR